MEESNRSSSLPSLASTYLSHLCAIGKRIDKVNVRIGPPHPLLSSFEDIHHSLCGCHMCMLPWDPCSHVT